jgi:hypothetical protein
MTYSNTEIQVKLNHLPKRIFNSPCGVVSASRRVIEKTVFKGLRVNNSQGKGVHYFLSVIGCPS